LIVEEENPGFFTIQSTFNYFNVAMFVEKKLVYPAVSIVTDSNVYDVLSNELRVIWSVGKIGYVVN